MVSRSRERVQVARNIRFGRFNNMDGSNWIGITLVVISVFIKLVCFHCQVPASGMLILTDEEKRTFIAEGYPVPTRWPLSKQDEKNLKKVQRKIKNKVDTVKLQGASWICFMHDCII